MPARLTELKKPV